MRTAGACWTNSWRIPLLFMEVAPEFLWLKVQAQIALKAPTGLLTALAGGEQRLRQGEVTAALGGGAGLDGRARPLCGHWGVPEEGRAEGGGPQGAVRPAVPAQEPVDGGGGGLSGGDGLDHRAGSRDHVAGGEDARLGGLGLGVGFQISAPEQLQSVLGGMLRLLPHREDQGVAGQDLLGIGLCLDDGGSGLVKVEGADSFHPHAADVGAAQYLRKLREGKRAIPSSRA